MDKINSTAAANILNITAFAHGDRVELHSTLPVDAVQPFFVSTPPGTANVFYRAAYLAPQRPFFSNTGQDGYGHFQTHLEAPAGIGWILEASTDLRTWTAGSLVFDSNAV